MELKMVFERGHVKELKKFFDEIIKEYKSEIDLLKQGLIYFEEKYYNKFRINFCKSDNYENRDKI